MLKYINSGEIPDCSKSKESELLQWSGSKDFSYEGPQWLVIDLRLDRNWPEKYNRAGKNIPAPETKTIDA